MRRNPFGPIRVGSGLLHKVAEWRREDGRVLGVYRLGDPDDGPLCYEDPMDQLFEVVEIKLEPYRAPPLGILAYPYKYGT